MTTKKSGVSRMNRSLSIGGYVRVSDPKQVTDEDGNEKVSLSEQKADIIAHAKSHYPDYDPEQIIWWEDAGLKGWSRHRAGFKAMLEAIRSGEVDVIIVWHSDRLIRDFRPLVELEDALKSSDVQILSVRDYVDLDMLS